MKNDGIYFLLIFLFHGTLFFSTPCIRPAWHEEVGPIVSISPCFISFSPRKQQLMHAHQNWQTVQKPGQTSCFYSCLKIMAKTTLTIQEMIR